MDLKHCKSCKEKYTEVWNTSSNIQNSFNIVIAQSAGAVEYTDCFSAEG